MSNPNPILNSNSNSNSKLDSSTTRKPAKLHTSQSLETITGNGLVASPIDTRFPESHPESGIADTHHDRESEGHFMTFSGFSAEGGRYADKLNMGDRMLSLGSDQSMDAFGSGCEFPPLPNFLPEAPQARVDPTLPEIGTGVGISRRFTSHLAGEDMLDMNTRSTARRGRRFGSVVLDDTPRSESAPPSIGAVSWTGASQGSAPNEGSERGSQHLSNMTSRLSSPTSENGTPVP